MIEAIVIAIGGSLTAITTASLWFASVIDKRERERRKKEEEEAEDEADDGSFTMGATQPFAEIRIHTKCPFCGLGGTQDTGPKIPKACRWGEICSAHETLHLHVECMSCKARWPMMSADEAPSPPAGPHTILPFQVICVGAPCAMCGARAANDDAGTKWVRGPGPPKACNGRKCAARETAHLHVECRSCGARYFMATADTTKKPEAKKPVKKKTEDVSA